MLITVFIFLLLAPPISAQITHGQSRILYENFDTPSLSTSIWNTGYPWGSYYNHRANTLPRQAKVTGDGFLNITATRERSITLGLMTEFGPMDLDFTSGAVNTNGKLCIKNGFIDISLRVPETGSTWPSVFLIPENEGALPMLTVMEVFNSRSRYSYGFRYTNNQGSVQQDTFVAENKQTSDGIHRYGLDWGYDQITWYYDDKWVNTITKTNELRQVDNMCLIVALGVGGKAKDTPIDPQGYPATMSINLVEVWQPKYDGYYKFQNVQTGLLMETDSASLDAGARVLQWHDLGGDWQKWHVRYAGHGQFSLIAAHSRLGIDADGWGTSDGTKLLQWDYHSTNNQLWKIQVVNEDVPDIVQLINVHTISNPNGGNMISVPAGDTSPGVQLHLWRNLNSDLQKWKMIRV